jgi:A/G-specific adenine glycosylase
LLAWYDKHRRDLPWRRRQHDAYAQWVAEIMLQQTRVDTVLRYYERFLRRFPDVSSLARADAQDVLKHWEGLGYYRRILHLHRAARLLHEQGRDVPTTVDELRELPGVGQYTASAIASIAFGQPVAAVDGNVARVVSRLIRLPISPKRPEGKQAVAELAATLLSRRRAGEFNQAWMDLGSSICTPRVPRCDSCPLQSDCAAAQAGDAESYPMRELGRVRPPRELRVTVVVYVHGGKMLVRRRAEGGLWSGLWEFPSGQLGRSRPPIRAMRDWADEFGLRGLRNSNHAGEVRHELTHRSIRFDVWTVEVESKTRPPKQARWVSAAEFARLPVSTAHRKVFAAIRKAGPR